MRHKLKHHALYTQKVFTSLTDKILIKKVKKGNREAFGSLYRRYLDSIYRYIYFKVGKDRETAEDLTQVVFFRALVKIDSFDEEGIGFRPWIYKIAHNLVIDHYRGHKTNVGLTEILEDKTQNIEEKVLLDLEVQTVLRAIEELGREQRDVVMMRFVSGLSNKEIAEASGKREDAVRSMIYRSLKNLRTKLKKNE